MRRRILCFLTVAAGIGIALSQTTPSTDPDLAAVLIHARRIFVEPFGDDTQSKTIQAMVTDGISMAKRFIITENKERADLILRGSAFEKTSQELHSTAFSVIVGGAAANRRSASAHQAGTADSQTSTETVSDARAAVRLNLEGW